jgi:glutathione synthase/RimK-type ligase-like ATP-grasp enzyme
MPYKGMAPFLRMSIAGVDMRPLAQAMLAQAGAEPDNAALWLTLSTLMLAIGQRDSGLAIQGQALSMARTYRIPAASQPPRLTVLVLMTDGELSANTPLECLLENTDIELIYYYLSPQAWFAEEIPEHDVLLVGMGESDATQVMLQALPEILAQWPRPVLNHASHIPKVGREYASAMLQGVPGLLMPPTWRTDRATLQQVAAGTAAALACWADCDFPLIVRPVGSHGGHGLARIADTAALAAYLAAEGGDDFYVSRFVDYSGADGQFRKARVALVSGQAFACHMAVSSHWMVHYLNAGMYDDADKRAQELAFMDRFDDFVARHRVALDEIASRTGLDYVCIDCAETRDGELLVFEIDHAMVVHAMDEEHMFPYKQIHMAKVRNAFRDLLLRTQAAGQAAA